LALPAPPPLAGGGKVPQGGGWDHWGDPGGGGRTGGGQVGWLGGGGRRRVSGTPTNTDWSVYPGGLGQKGQVGGTRGAPQVGGPRTPRSTPLRGGPRTGGLRGWVARASFLRVAGLPLENRAAKHRSGPTARARLTDYPNRRGTVLAAVANTARCRSALFTSTKPNGMGKARGAEGLGDEVPGPQRLNPRPRWAAAAALPKISRADRRTLSLLTKKRRLTHDLLDAYG